MLSKIITPDFIEVQVDCSDWKGAIICGAKILEDAEFVEKHYKYEILKSFDKFGTYMVIAPGIVLSHAAPENGVMQTGISMITLKQPIAFGSESNDPVKLVITLAAKDKIGHMDILAKLMEFLMNQEDVDGVKYAETKEEVVAIMKKYG